MHQVGADEDEGAGQKTGLIVTGGIVADHFHREQNRPLLVTDGQEEIAARPEGIGLIVDYLPDKARSLALRLFDVWEVALRNWRICHAEEKLGHRVGWTTLGRSPAGATSYVKKPERHSFGK